MTFVNPQQPIIHEVQFPILVKVEIENVDLRSHNRIVLNGAESSNGEIRWIPFHTGTLAPLEFGYGHACWFEGTKQPIADWVESSIALFPQNYLSIVRGLGGGDPNVGVSEPFPPFICAMTFNATMGEPTNLDLNWHLKDSDPVVKGTFQLQPPAAGFANYHATLSNLVTREPDTIRSASSTIISFDFEANASGEYLVRLLNGPSSSPRDHNSGGFADSFCTAGSNKEFARITYQSGIKPGLDVSIRSPESGVKMSCRIFYDNQHYPLRWEEDSDSTSQLLVFHSTYPANLATPSPKFLLRKYLPMARATLGLFSFYFETSMFHNSLLRRAKRDGLQCRSYNQI